MDVDELWNRFTHHYPVGQIDNQYSAVRTKAGHFAIWLNDRIPECREKSLAITHLEEMVFWANAALARNQEDAKEQTHPLGGLLS